MSPNQTLSSEQALKDYFSALLDEVAEELELDQEIVAQTEQKINQPLEVVPQLQLDAEPLLPMRSVGEVEAPSLVDVQRLLDRLEGSDPVTNVSGVDDLITQNTVNLHIVDKPDIEEIQEWDIEDEPVVEVEALAEESDVEIDSEEELSVSVEVSEEIEHQVEDQVILNEATWTSTEREHAFQVLFFDVYGVTFAVPLDELGGIHRLEETSHLIGRPSWYLGLQSNKDNQLDVVDTAKWVMPDKLIDDSYKESYDYIVMLGESLWGLASGALKGTELIQTDEVRWRSTAGKRPWLAGMVKEKMCALIHVEALIQMLDAGQDVNALEKL
ncbi:chemotaxis protein CheW [Vibrio sp. RC27]